MDKSFTQNLAKLEEYSLALIEFFDKLPDSFFDGEILEPSDRVVNNILRYSKSKSNSLNQKERHFRFAMN